jgi:hypothetical protein
MKFRIHFEIKGFEDSIDIFGDTIEEIRETAATELFKRGVDITTDTSCWSEPLFEAQP